MKQLTVAIEELERNNSRSRRLHIVNGIINLNVKHIEEEYGESNSFGIVASSTELNGADL